MSGTRRKLIIDADIGIDDAQAINFLIATQAFDILAITLVAGNAEMDTITLNCHRILEYVSARHIPIYEAGSYNLQGTYIKSDGYFGKNAFANIELPDGEKKEKNSMSSAEAIVHYVRKYPGEVDLLCIGPFTNLALAFFLDNNLPSLFGQITILGTDYNEKSKYSVTNWADFNTWCDPLSLKIIAKCFTKLKNPIKTIDFKLCCEFAYPFHPTNELNKHKDSHAEPNKHRDLFALLCDSTNPILARNYRREGFICCDLHGAIIIYDPSVILETKRFSIDVELQGEKIGHVYFKEDENGIIELVTKVDTQKMVEDILKVLKVNV